MKSRNTHPRIKIPRNALDTVTDMITAGGIVFMFAFLILKWPDVPDLVPMHAGLSGTIDKWGSKATLWLIPAISTALMLLLTVIARYPHVFNYAVEITERNAPAQYRNALSLLAVFKAELAVVFSYIVWDFTGIAIAPRAAMSLGVYFLIAAGLGIIGTMGFFIYRAYKLK